LLEESYSSLYCSRLLALDDEDDRASGISGTDMEVRDIEEEESGSGRLLVRLCAFLFIPMLVPGAPGPLSSLSYEEEDDPEPVASLVVTGR
jgi:hypothetical protein